MDPVAFFKNEFYSSAESPAEKVEVLQNVCIVADCLEADAVRSRLVPLLHEMAKPTIAGSTNDEVLHTLATQALVVAKYVGDEIQCVVPLLETLAAHDESVVSEAAVNSIASILSELCPESRRASFATEYLLPTVLRLASAVDPEMFPGRTSAASLAARIYKYLNESSQAELRAHYLALLRDEIPVVKRAASGHLAELIEASESSDITQFLPCLVECWKDVPQRETSRIHAIDGIKVSCKFLDESSVMRQLIPMLRQAVNDPSWRVRLAVVDRLDDILKNSGAKIFSDTLTGWVTTLLLDPEMEVQSSTVGALIKCLDALPNQAVEMRILPILEGTIVNSQAVQARVAMAEGLGAIARKLPKNTVVNRAVPLLAKLLDDKVREVRCSAIPQICDFCEVLGPSAALGLLLPSVSALVTDRQWRVRLVLVEQLARVGVLLGSRNFFDSQWGRILFQSLIDGASAVRDATLDALVKMGQSYGEQEVSRHLVTSIIELFDQSFRKSGGSRQAEISSPDNSGRSPQAYTLRNTLLRALRKLAIIAPKQDVQENIVPRLVQTASSDIPNLRFLALSILGSLVKENRIEAAFVREKLLPLLAKSEREDSDPDVRYFAAIHTEVCNEWLKAQ